MSPSTANPPIEVGASDLARKEADRARFETELEFVQCLANPFYLQSLAQQGVFGDDVFLNYLDYLKYWHLPQYARFIQYPQCLHHLDLLSHEVFREALKAQNVAQELAGKQLEHWATWREPVRSVVKEENANYANGVGMGP